MPLWQEYALEPSLFEDYGQARYLLSDFGIDSGRLIGAFPRKWEKAVRGHLTKYSDLQRKIVIERLLKLQRVIVPRTYAYDGNLKWRDQAVKCDLAEPFHAIILDGPDPLSKAIDGTGDLSASPLWRAEGKTSVPRIATELARALEFMLKQCHELLIVDREFIPSGGTNNKWLKPLSSISTILDQHQRIDRFELHTLDKPVAPWPDGKFVNDCAQHLPRFIPNGMPLTAHLWRQKQGGIQFHKRLILTDVGGVLLDPGIDEGKPGETYDIELLHDSECADALKLFNRPSPVYDLVASTNLVGKA